MTLSIHRSLMYALTVPIILGAACGSALAEQKPLPNPLNLEDALLLVSKTHPQVYRSAAERELAEAEMLAARAGDDVTVGLTLDSRWIEPSDIAVDQSDTDSSAKLLARKQLYDFGRTRSSIEAAESDLAGYELRHVNSLQQHKLSIMRRFFGVILADLEFARDNEAMAVAFIAADKARDRNELGQVSDIDLLEKESNYQQVRVRRYASEARQRSSRALLAQAINRPTDLPGELMAPSLPENNQSLPDYEQLIEQALAYNPRLKAARLAFEAASKRVIASKAARRPVLSAEVEAAEYERETSSRNPVEAGLVLEIPLYQGKRIKADVARSRAELKKIQAESLQLEYSVRQQVLEVWQDIQRLQAQREQAEVFTEFRELALDRSRARYEMDLETNFGDSLVGQSEARLFAARAEFELALAWARLAILTGQSYSPVVGQVGGGPSLETSAGSLQ